jgi:DNA-binding SARP family transcriptional activator/TolB-like protein
LLDGYRIWLHYPPPSIDARRDRRASRQLSRRMVVMALSIGVLGSLMIEIDGERLGKTPRKARALLAYLAAQGGRAVSRERLADLLWPYQGTDQARHSLRNCLLELRKALGAGADAHLGTDFSTCRVHSAEVDVDRFERLARSQHTDDLRTAGELYRGEFLADFIVDSEPFQEWLAAERDRTLDLVCGVLQRLATQLDAAGEHDAAIQAARRLVALDPLSEIGHRAVIRAYMRAGRRPEALRQYRSCAEILKRELDVAPDSETQALAREIAQSGGLAEPPVKNRAAEDRGAVRPLDRSDNSPVGRPDQRYSSSSPGAANRQWPCLLSTIAIGVAPVRNLTGEAAHQYVVDGLTDDLVTDLLEHGRGLSLKPIGDEQQIIGNPGPPSDGGFDYLVTGSAQRSSSGALRVNMRIMHAATAEYRWAERHEFRLDEVGPTQTDITRRISRQLHTLALQEASSRASAAFAEELGVNDCLSRGAAAFHGEARAELVAEAQRWYLAALARDPRNVEALSGLAFTCQHLVGNPWWGDSHAVAASSDLGLAAAAIALDLAPGHALSKCIQGMFRSASGQLEAAASDFAQALSMDRELAIAHGFAGYNAAFLGHAEDTLPAVERAMRLDRMDRRRGVWYFFGGFSELLLGRVTDALGMLEKSLHRNPRYGSAQLFQMAALSLLGRRNEAARAAALFRQQYPEYPANAFEQLWLSRSASAVYRAQIYPIFEQIRSLGIAS